MIEHKDLFNLLKTLNIPVAYDHFNSNKEVSIPFIVYRELALSTFRAENLTYYKAFNYEIELITEKKEIALER